MSKCYICDAEIDGVVLDSRDNKTCPCTVCQAVIQKTVEQLEARAKRKEQLMIWKNETTGEISLSDLDDIEDASELEDLDELLYIEELTRHDDRYIDE